MTDFQKLYPKNLPKTLDPKEYYNLSPEYKHSEEARAAIRANLKRQYQLQLNNPHRKDIIEDPALIRWVYARNNIYTNFRATTKTSLMGLVFGLVPVVGFSYFFKANRESREEQLKAGTRKRPQFGLV